MQESYFDGNLFQLIGWRIVGALVTCLTLGICAPFAVVLVKRWEAKHTVIDGKRLQFDGRGIQLWGKYLLWMLLTLITIGIYGFFVAMKMKKWVVKHTHFAGAAE